ncbi:PAS domain S-box protein [bacterium]|nr:PAS domain S-box protein [bacterium]
MKKAKIQIVEDEAIVAMGIESLLRNLGYDVTSIADSGEKAIADTERYRPDIVLMDIRIKGEMDGIDLAEIIRNRYEIPVIFSTAYLDKDRIERAKLTMPFGYILKPIQERELGVTIEMALYVTQVDRKRRQVEESLRNSENKMRSIFRVAPTGIGLVKDRVLYEVNHRICEMVGYSKEELIGKSARILYMSDEAFALVGKNKYGQIAEQGTGVVETRWRKKDGSLIDILLASTLIDTHDPSKGVTFTALDITARKQGEEILRESEQRYRMLFERSSDAIFLVDLNTGRYLDGNAAAERLTGRSVSELKKLTVHDVAPSHAPERLQACSSAKQAMTMGEATYLRPDGSSRVALLSMVPFNEHTVFGIAHDITELKKAQEVMVQTEKMMSLGGLAAGMAHELNNPLGAILQGSQNLQRRLLPDFAKNIHVAEKYNLDLADLQKYLDEREIFKFLHGIRESGKRAAKIIKDMLLFSRQSESQIAPVNIVGTIEKALKLASQDYDMKKKYDFKFIEIEKSFDPDLSIVPCTETEIEQVILNLLRNSAQAMSRHQLTPNPKISLRTMIDEDMARIEVQDNGPGMDEKTRKKIFEPFFTTKPVGEGTGLGLSVSYMIITSKHKGSLAVESEIGRGTRFIIKLPLQR